MDEKIKKTLILMTIIATATLVLSVVNSYTSPVIEQAKKEQITTELQLLFPDYEYLKKNPVYEKGIIIGEYYEIYNEFDQKIGYAINKEVQGYQSTITMLVGFNQEKRIHGIKILQQMETKDIGDKIEENEFLNKFNDRNKEDLRNIDAISGATISSTAVKKGIEESFKLIEK